METVVIHSARVQKSDGVSPVWTVELFDIDDNLVETKTFESRHRLALLIGQCRKANSEFVLKDPQ